jgi:hypothetical protein
MRWYALGKSVLARCSGRLVLSALALAVGLLVGPLLAGHASAYLGVCATDPVVVLSDGMRVTVTTAIVDTPKDVRSVVYTIPLELPRFSREFTTWS